MTDTAPNHYSHSFVLNLDKLPTKKSDRIALHILYPGLIFGTILILLGFYELFNGLSHSRTDFDFIPENEGDVIYQPFMNPTFFDLVIILVGAGIVLSLFLSYIRYKKNLFRRQKGTNYLPAGVRRQKSRQGIHRQLRGRAFPHRIFPVRLHDQKQIHY